MKPSHINHPDFEFFNPNKHKCGDCTIRAIVKVTGKDWVNVFDDLCAIGRKMQRMPNDMKCIEKYLAGFGFKWVAIKPEPGETRPTVLDVVNWSKRNPGDRYIAFAWTFARDFCNESGVLRDSIRRIGLFKSLNTALWRKNN